jgi:hypothetical protein
MNKLQRVEFFCPFCDNRLEAPALYRGNDLKCQFCEKVMKVPLDAAILGKPPSSDKNLSKKEVFFYLMGTIIFIIWMFNDSSENYNSSSTTSNGDTANSSNRVKQDSPLVETASSEQLRRINSALRDKYPVSNTLTVRSQTHRLAYYVGASFSINVVGGEDKVVGIWIMNGEKNNPNSVFSVNEMAYQFSGMGRAKDTKVGASVVDSEAQVLERALKE